MVHWMAKQNTPVGDIDRRAGAVDDLPANCPRITTEIAWQPGTLLRCAALTLRGRCLCLRLAGYTHRHCMRARVRPCLSGARVPVNRMAPRQAVTVKYTPGPAGHDTHLARCRHVTACTPTSSIMAIT